MTFPDRYYYNGSEMKKMSAGFDMFGVNHAVAFLDQKGAIRDLKQEIKPEYLPSQIGLYYSKSDSSIVIFPQFLYDKMFDELRSIKLEAKR